MLTHTAGYVREKNVHFTSCLYGVSATQITAPPSESKDEIKAIIDEAKASGATAGLSDAQQNILVKALQDHRNELQLSETTRPSVQLSRRVHAFSLIHRRYIAYGVIFRLVHLTPIFVAPECPSTEVALSTSFIRQESSRHQSVAVMLLSPGGSKLFKSVVLLVGSQQT